MLQPRDRLIVALDVPSAAQARQIVQTIGEAAVTYKIGKQLFTAEGPQVVRDLVSSGRKVFLDLKFHDIPNTVAAAVKSAAGLGVSMLTVHASGGSKMLKAAVEAASQSAARPMILAVTVLTSLSDSDLQELGVTSNVLRQVLRLGAMARNARLWRVGRLRTGSSRAATGAWARVLPSSHPEFAPPGLRRLIRHESSRRRTPSPPEPPISSSAGPSSMPPTQPKRPSRLCDISKRPSHSLGVM